MEDEKVCVGCDEEHGHIYSITVPDYKIKLNPGMLFVVVRCFWYRLYCVVPQQTNDKTVRISTFLTLIFFQIIIFQLKKHMLWVGNWGRIYQNLLRAKCLQRVYI